MNDQLDLRPVPGRTDAPPLSKPASPGSPPGRRRNRWVTPVGSLLVALVAGFVAWKLLGSHRHAAPTGRQGPGGAPQSVGVATIATGDVQVVMTGLGAVTPLATVTVKTQINGQLQQIAFTEGQIVHKGDFLAQIDPRPYQVALEQAQGTLLHDQGLLAQARADNARYQTLSRQDSISRQQVEDQVYLIKQYEGTVLADQGAVDSAKLNLTYCHIVSPVDGRIGIRLVDVGNYVQTSDSTGLVVVTQLEPISVLFTLPEDDVSQIRRQMAAGTLQVTAWDRTDTTLISTGTLATFDNQIDATTGTVKLRAMFDNADDALFPQQFVNARLLVQTLHGVVTAPTAAIQHGAPGDFVYLVKPDDTVAIQVVKTGVTQADVVEVKDGLKPGDKVVTDGLDRLKDGAKVVVAGERGAGKRGQGGQGGQAGAAGSGQATAPTE
jgi:multidrug efflux system membrane fusion protein